MGLDKCAFQPAGGGWVHAAGDAEVLYKILKMRSAAVQKAGALRRDGQISK
jgi:hypothetical protein